MRRGGRRDACDGIDEDRLGAADDGRRIEGNWMKAAIIVLAVVGAICLLGGIGALVDSARPASDSATITIPSGANWYYAYDFSLLASGHLSGTFQERSGGTVDVYVLTDAEFNVYDGGGSPQPLFSTSGVSGVIDVALPGSDTFHLVFDHGAGYDSLEQDVTVAITVSGIGPPIIVLAVVGAICLLGGIGALVDSARPASDSATISSPCTRRCSRTCRTIRRRPGVRRRICSPLRCRLRRRRTKDRRASRRSSWRRSPNSVFPR